MKPRDPELLARYLKAIEKWTKHGSENYPSYEQFIKYISTPKTLRKYKHKKTTFKTYKKPPANNANLSKESLKSKDQEYQEWKNKTFNKN